MLSKNPSESQQQQQHQPHQQHEQSNRILNPERIRKFGTAGRGGAGTVTITITGNAAAQGEANGRKVEQEPEVERTPSGGNGKQSEARLSAIGSSKRSAQTKDSSRPQSFIHRPRNKLPSFQPCP